MVGAAVGGGVVGGVVGGADDGFAVLVSVDRVGGNAVTGADDAVAFGRAPVVESPPEHAARAHAHRATTASRRAIRRAG